MQKLLIIDFGSQYTQLLAKRIRDIGAYSEVVQFDDKISLDNVKGIILSGGPDSVYEEDSPTLPENILESKLPILGICYGMQLLARKFGGKVETRKIGEFGKTTIKIMDHSKLFENTDKEFNVWMSHKDVVIEAPNGFKVTSKTNNGIIASF
ncbi:MAG: glutamine-hydrolyzing GMP synthase, partial [Defluviitoga tunisiensis]